MLYYINLQCALSTYLREVIFLPVNYFSQMVGMRERERERERERDEIYDLGATVFMKPDYVTL